MPRHQKAMKDAINGETLRRAVNEQRHADIRMWQHTKQKIWYLQQYRGDTTRIEISQQGEEKKVKNDSLSSDERKKRNPNIDKHQDRQTNCMGRQSEEGETPVVEIY